MGLLWAALWISSQICAYNAIQILGYAVGPAIWIGTTIRISFFWGVGAFSNPVVSWPGAIFALLVLIAGVCLAAASSHFSGKDQERRARSLRQVGDNQGLVEAGRGDLTSSKEASNTSSAAKALFGLTCSLGTGLTNGSSMVPMKCFQQGCSAISINAYGGELLAPIAFLPSMAVGILIVQPIFFALYFSKQLLAGERPNFHFRIILNGLWGILYYKEITGKLPISLFVVSSLVIIVGAALDGKFG